jgi:hypothetical protein
MKKCLEILILAYFLLTISCSSWKSKIKESQSENNLQEKINDTVRCINYELYTNLKSYLNNFNQNYFFKKNIFSVYFFSKDAKKYFTIWMSQGIPYIIIRNNPDVTFRFSPVKIMDATVILITSYNEKPELYNCDPLTFDGLREKVANVDSLVVWHGSHFPETYEYWFNEKLGIRKIDSALVDFLGEEFLQYERTIKKSRK